MLQILNFVEYYCAQSLQSCLTFCDTMDYGPPGSSVHGILQARTLEWVAISFSSYKVWSEWSEVAQSCSTPCNPTDCQAPLSMGFSRQEHWSGLPFPSPCRVLLEPLNLINSIFCAGMTTQEGFHSLSFYCCSPFGQSMALLPKPPPTFILFWVPLWAICQGASGWLGTSQAVLLRTT